MLPKVIGGDFDNSASLSFEENNSETFQYFFPKKIGQRSLNFFETATDGLAKIIIEINSIHHNSIQFWFPKHYCFETINRLKNKLNGLVDFSVNSFENYAEIKKTNQEINVLMYNHFNRYNNSAPEILDEYKTNGWITIEDFVHAPLDISKTKADYSINSLRKLADIELAICYTNPSNIELSNEPSEYYKIKKEAALLKSNFLENGNVELEKRYLSLFKKAEAALDRKEIFSAFIKEIERSKKINWKQLLETRVNNYNFLSNNLSTEKTISLLQGNYMYLITKAAKRNELKKFMFDNSIFPVIHWHDSDDKIKEQIISFHIDQRYNISDMERTYLTINRFYEINE
jgi:hypothetical protein